MIWIKTLESAFYEFKVTIIALGFNIPNTKSFDLVVLLGYFNLKLTVSDLIPFFSLERSWPFYSSVKPGKVDYYTAVGLRS